MCTGLADQVLVSTTDEDGTSIISGAVHWPSVLQVVIHPDLSLTVEVRGTG